MKLFAAFHCLSMFLQRRLSVCSYLLGDVVQHSATSYSSRLSVHSIWDNVRWKVVTGPFSHTYRVYWCQIDWSDVTFEVFILYGIPFIMNNVKITQKLITFMNNILYWIHSKCFFPIWTMIIKFICYASLWKNKKNCWMNLKILLFCYTLFKNYMKINIPNLFFLQFDLNDHHSK